MPLFAMLIGINKYATSYSNFSHLRGTVSDALEFKTYLQDRLGIPSNQIVLLNDKAVTHSKIIEALKDLGNDACIEVGDAILLYYAGHGAEIDPPKYREDRARKKIQAIVLHDCNSINDSGQQVPPIPHYLLRNLLSKVVERKGDNIVSHYQ